MNELSWDSIEFEPYNPMLKPPGAISGTVVGALPTVSGNLVLVSQGIAGQVIGALPTINGNLQSNISGQVIGALPTVSGAMAEPASNSISGLVIGALPTVSGNLVLASQGIAGQVIGALPTVSGGLQSPIAGQVIGALPTVAGSLQSNISGQVIGALPTVNGGFSQIATGTIGVTSPVTYQTFQQNASNQHSIPANGTFTDPGGTLAGIEVSWNSGAWVDATLNTGAGTWSVTLPNQTAGQGTLTARFKNNTSIAASVQYVSIDDVFLIAGQSNAEGQFTSAQIYTRPASGVRSTLAKNGTWSELADPAKVLAGTPGTVWPVLANKILAANPNKVVSFIPTAKGSTGLVNPANWSKGGTEYNNFISYIQAAKINSAKTILWYQGEQDALNGTTKAQYKAALIQMVLDMRSDLGSGFSAIKLMPVAIGNTSNTDQTYIANISQMRLAVQELWDERTDLFVPGFCTYDNDFADESGDGIHWKSNAEAQILANRFWRMISNAYYSGTEGRSFKYSSISSPASNQITITFTGGIGNIAGASAAGWIITDNNGSRTVTAASSTGKTITLTCDQTLSGLVTVQLGYKVLGNTQAITIKDQGTIAPLPPETFEATINVPIFTPGSPDPVDLLNRAFAYYRFDEASSSTNWADAKSYANLSANGTVSSGTALASNGTGCVKFSAAQNLIAPDATTFLLPDTCTIVFTYKSTQGTTVQTSYFFFGKLDTGANQRSWGVGLAHATGTEKLQFFSSIAGTASVITDGPILTPRQQKRFVVVKYKRSIANNNAEISIAVDNGTPVVSTITGALHQSTARFTVGCVLNNGARQSPALTDLDALGFWAEDLPQAEIDYLFNSGNTRQL